MIISREHGFAFVHIWKSGGTSIARALGPFGTPQRQGVLASASRGFDRLLRATGRRPGKHAYALDVAKSIGPGFDDLYSFAFVRNPWDWLVSWYNFVKKETVSPDTGKPWRHHLYPVVAPMDFQEFVRWVTEDHGLGEANARKQSSFAGRTPVLQRDWIADHDGKIIVDFVGRFESLNEDFMRVCDRIGIPRVELPHVNKVAHNDFRSYYSPETREMVREYFKADIETFGYTFD